MMSFIGKSREFIVTEKDVTTVISAINSKIKYVDYAIGNCGWADYPDAWFIMFYATDKQYGKVVEGLLEIGNFSVDVRPGGQVDLWYKTK